MKRAIGFITYGPLLNSLLRWLSHGEDAVSIASAMAERAAQTLTVPSCAHIAATMLAGQVRRKKLERLNAFRIYNHRFKMAAEKLARAESRIG
jgi:hypothetical protein